MHCFHSSPRLGFDGLIVTDALVMQAITRHYGDYEAPIMALSAGADVVLMPVDPPGTIEAICAAVQTGRLSRERLHASLGTIRSPIIVRNSSCV